MMQRLLTTPVRRILGYRWLDHVSTNVRELVKATETRQYHFSHFKMSDTANKEGAEDQGLAEYYEKRKALYQTMTNKADNSDAVLDWYDKEADIYEAQFEKAGFEYHSAFVETTLTLAKDKQAKILDVAAGSGKAGMELRRLGYMNLDGLDGSSAMLALAEEKKIYNEYICCTVGSEKLPDVSDGHGGSDGKAPLEYDQFSRGIVELQEMSVIPSIRELHQYIFLFFILCHTASYDFVFCAGGVSRGHLSLETIPTMLRAVKPNGYLYFNHSSWSAQFPEYSFEKLDHMIEVLRERGLCSSADKKEGYFNRPGEPTTMYIIRRGDGEF